MAHSGSSHTGRNGSPPYQRIADEGFAGLSDCGESIGRAGPYPTAWDGVYSVQESMAHEPLGGWHRIHLFSTTLHRIGIGVYVDSGGWNKTRRSGEHTSGLQSRSDLVCRLLR